MRAARGPRQAGLKPAPAVALLVVGTLAACALYVRTSARTPSSLSDAPLSAPDPATEAPACSSSACDQAISVRRPRRLGLLSVAVLLLVLVAGAALASWSSVGTGSAAASTGTLNAPTNASATFGSGAVTVTWTGSSGTTTPQGYYVVRIRTSDGVTAPACGTSSTILTASTATSCTDSTVPAGTFTFAVIAVHRSWTATSASSANLTLAATGSLSFSTQPVGTSSQTALATQPAVTIRNQANQIDTTSTASLTLALTTSGGATLSCTANPKTPTNGVVTFAGCKVDKAGTYTLTANGGSLTSATSTASRSPLAPRPRWRS